MWPSGIGPAVCAALASGRAARGAKKAPAISGLAGGRGSGGELRDRSGNRAPNASRETICEVGDGGAPQHVWDGFATAGGQGVGGGYTRIRQDGAGCKLIG